MIYFELFTKIEENVQLFCRLKFLNKYGVHVILSCPFQNIFIAIRFPVAIKFQFSTKFVHENNTKLIHNLKWNVTVNNLWFSVSVDRKNKNVINRHLFQQFYPITTRQ